MRSTSQEFAVRVGRLMRSFPVERERENPDATMSLVVAPPSKSRTIRPFHYLFRDGSRVGRTTQHWHLFRYLEHQLDMLLAERVNDRLLLHAGAVSSNGQGMLLPGPSGSGKSSLALALTQGGFNYLSDEIAIIVPATGEVHPFPKPFSIKNRSLFPDLACRDRFWFGPDRNEVGPVWYTHAEDVRNDCIGTAVPVRYIVFPTYMSEAKTALRPMTATEGLRELISNSINLPAIRSHGTHLAAALAQNAQCYSLNTSDLSEATELIWSLTRD